MAGTTSLFGSGGGNGFLRNLDVASKLEGLDHDDVLDLFELIQRRSAKGRAYLVISHREELAAAAHRRLEIRHGRIEEVVG